MAERVSAYGAASPAEPIAHDEEIEDELVERAVTLLAFMPRNQPREKVEQLLSPSDRNRGRRAVDALIEARLAVEDERGRLRRIA